MERDTNAIDTEATQWVVRQDGSPLTADEQCALDAWLAADPRHHGAYLRADAHWRDLDRWAADRRAQGCSQPTARKTFRVPWALAAGVAILACLGTVIWHLQHADRETYASAIGEVRNIELSDGTHLTLNTNTVATVMFQAAEREIALTQGEALFQVARDVNRPFVVRANDVEIKAIGTAFTVRIDNGRTDVVVTEGVVEIARNGTGGREVRRVSAQQRATLASRDSRADIEPLAQEAVLRKLAWRDGKAVFAGEPLSIAIAEINRHSRSPLYVDDVSLAGRRVIGVFNANDATAFANAVAATFGAEAVQQDDGIHLRLNPSQKN